MNFTIPRATFLAALSRVLGVIPKVSASAILTQVLLVVADLALRVEGTNGIMSAASTVPVHDGTPGRVCLPAHRLHALVASLPDGDVSVKVENRKATVKAVGKQARGTITGLDAELYPATALTASGAALTIPGAMCASLIARVGHAIPTQADAPARVKGMYLEWDASVIRAVALDMYRFSAYETAHESGVSGAVLVPAPAVKELRRLCAEGDVAVSVDGAHVYFVTGSTRLSSKLIDGDFPAYRSIVPEQVPGAKVKVDDLVQALGCAAALADDDGAVLRIALAPGVVTVANRAASNNTASDEISAEYGVPPITAYCDLRHVRDACGAVDEDTVTLEVSDPLKPLVIRATGHVQFIMTKDPAKAEPKEASA